MVKDKKQLSYYWNLFSGVTIDIEIAAKSLSHYFFTFLAKGYYPL
ncbi:hypothetical protein DFQ12_4015 [Sphingobacterium detergens]|uniref:Uncharacterized protein n=1 Tax=Sphingobacterium detergens TaxID=1145106 RepID=A0A420AQW6_SPHD1|nr:hypothetical protein DFQ12_4015 [Sphingobacterium detergens]